MRKKAALFLLLILGIFALTGCFFAEQESPNQESADGNGKIKVVCTIFPQYDFVRQIAGDRADVSMLIRPGADVHHYEPTPQDIIDIYDCDLFIYGGGESDDWADNILEAAGSSDREIIAMMECCDTIAEETTEGMWVRPMEGREHDHEHDGRVSEEHDQGTESDVGQDHGHDETGSETHMHADEHVWTSPANAADIVSEICRRLCSMDPENAAYYTENTEDYLEKLSMLQQSFHEITDAAENRTIVFGDRFPILYFVKEFGLEYKAAYKGCASGSEAGAETVAYLIDYVKENDIPAVFRLELSNGNIASAISEASGCRVLTFNSCHNLTKEEFDRGETYISLMEKNLISLKEALG